MKNRIRNFQIQTKLGSGSYGVIYKALNKTNKEICVLKQIGLMRLSEKAKKNAVNEATIMGKLVHPFIVRYRQSFIEENTLNIVMEFCDSGDLSNYLKLQNKRPLKEEKIWKIFLSICLGLQYIHKNKILHRDIKTLNIFMNKNEEIKIGDLGVAKMLTSNEFAQTMVGTPFYLSPELCEEKPYNEKSDIWALGCLLYELCTFRHPFEAQNQASLILKIIRGKYLPIPQFYSSDLKEMIELCLERDYKRRPTTSNILSKPKIKEYLTGLSLESTVEQHMQTIQREKQTAYQKEQMVLPPQKKVTPVQIKSEPPKETPKISMKKMSQKEPQVKRILQVKKENKNDFATNLQKMIEERPIKAVDNFKKQENIQRILSKVEQIKKSEEIKKIEEIKREQKVAVSKNIVSSNLQKPSISDDKKSNFNNNQVNPADKPKDLVSQLRSPNLSKPNILPPKPPNVLKDQPIKVKQEKIVQAKVYQSQKNMVKPQCIIKSGGFTPISQEIQSQKGEKQKIISYSKEKPKPERSIMSAKRPSLNQEKIQKQEVKHLFGPSPSAHHKSERVVNYNPMPLVNERQSKKQQKKQEINRMSRVRKGVKNELSRNAKNASKMNQISKEQYDQVKNLPNKIKDGRYSDSSQQEESIRKLSQINKRKAEDRFELKEINNDLVLQKYEDMMRSQQRRQTEMSQSNHYQRKEQDQDLNQEEQDEDNGQNIMEDIQYNRKDSGKSNQQIQQILQSQDLIMDLDNHGQNIRQKEEYEQNMQYYKDAMMSQQQSQWSFDEEPELPMLQEKESPYFEQNNPYLMEQQPQEESLENKIIYLQVKLEENIKRQDEINKLMQIKMEQCRKFIKNQKIFQEILDFFRKKLNMDEEYTDDDEKQIEAFLKRKGLTDHRKFQNIYKIMHFEMQLQNTRKIIQRICKKLSELETSV